MPAAGEDIAIVNPLTRIGDRVAASEARIEGLKEDTAIIRSSIHSINGEIQKMGVFEERCASSLKLIEEHNRQQNVDIRTLLDAQQQVGGAIWATARIASVVVTLLAGIAGLVVATVWSLEHLKVS